MQTLEIANTLSDGVVDSAWDVAVGVCGAYRRPPAEGREELHGKNRPFGRFWVAMKVSEKAVAAQARGRCPCQTRRLVGPRSSEKLVGGWSGRKLCTVSWDTPSSAPRLLGIQPAQTG